MKSGWKIWRSLLSGILIGLVVWMQAVPASALSVADEEELGRKYKAVMFRYLDFLPDPVLRTYLDRVGRSLAVHYARLAYKPEFHLWDSDQLNAFAAPAGMIVISRGLLEKFENVDELAGVLAHELAHSAERHLADSMEKASKMKWAALAGFVAAALVGAATGNGDASTGLLAGTVAASQQMALAYSREHEREADQVGIGMMEQAGYNPRGSLTSLEKLKKASELSRVAAPAYLRTHPALNDRIVFLSAIRDPRPPGSVSPDQDDWPWFLARMAAESGNKDYLAKLQGPLADYAQGLTALRSGRDKEALGLLARVYRAEPKRLGTAQAYALALHRNGDSGQALAVLEKILPQRPGDQGVLLQLGEIRLDRGEFEKAVSRFKEVQGLWPSDPMVHRLLGTAYGRAGMLYEAHLNLAESYVLAADREKALRNFNLAKQQAKTEALKEAVEKRIKEVVKLLPAEKKNG